MVMLKRKYLFQMYDTDREEFVCPKERCGGELLTHEELQKRLSEWPRLESRPPFIVWCLQDPAIALAPDIVAVWKEGYRKGCIDSVGSEPSEIPQMPELAEDERPPRTRTHSSSPGLAILMSWEERADEEESPG